MGRNHGDNRKKKYGDLHEIRAWMRDVCHPCFNSGYRWTNAMVQRLAGVQAQAPEPMNLLKEDKNSACVLSAVSVFNNSS